MPILENFGRAIDKFACAVSPSWGNRRLAERATSELLEHNTRKIKEAGFRRRGKSRLRQRSFKQAESNPARDDRYVTSDRSINSLLDDQLVDLQVRANGLFGENSIAQSAVEARVTYEVGAGLSVKPGIKSFKDDSGNGVSVSEEQARRANDVLLDTIRCWSMHGVDKSRTMSFAMAQRLMVREFANNGECFLLLGDAPYSGRGIHQGPIPTAIEFISPMRVETPYKYLNDPNVRLGVRYENKQVVGYYVLKNTPNDDIEPETAEYEFYSRFDSAGNPRMVHIFEPMFAGQCRGIPWIVAAMNKMLDFDDYQEAEIIAKQVEACFGLVFKIKPKEEGTSMYDYALAAADTDPTTDPNELMESVSPAFIERIGDEDDIQVVDPARPGSNYAPFLEGTLRMVAGACNIPYEIIAKNFFRTTYSSGKLAMLDGQMGFNMRRSTLIDAGLIPVYRRVVSDRVFADEARGTIPIQDYVRDPDRFTAHHYQAKQMGEIDDVKRMTAFTKAQEAGVATKESFYADAGNDWEAKQDQLKVERMREIDDQLELELYEMKRRHAMGLPEQPSGDPDSDETKNEPKKEKDGLAA